MSSVRIAEFDVWRPGYGLASVLVLVAGTDTPASIFTDEALTVVAPNPQTLLERLGTDDISYGKFQFPVYVGVGYSLQIDGTDDGGIVRPPLVSLDGEDASGATVIPTGRSLATALDDLFARSVDVRDFGLFQIVGAPGASASTNNASLVAAIAAAGSAGGGYVDIPDGTFLVTADTVPEGVVLRGKGRGATVLQSSNAGNVFTISGPRAGFSRLTLDGLTLIGGSVGVYAAGVDQIVFDDVEVKRFETGIWRKGGQVVNWRELYISNCTNGYRCHGDSALGAGGPIRFNAWHGGRVELCSTIGVELKFIDSACDHNTFEGVTFDTNTGTALTIIGAHATKLPGCQWITNGTNLAVFDGSPLIGTNSVVGIEVCDGEIDGGAMTFSGTYRDIVFRRMVLKAIAITINAPGQNIVVEDCELSGLTFAGVQSCWVYRETRNSGASFIATSGNVPAKIWGITLQSGQLAFLIGRVIGRQRNGTNTGFYYFAVSAGRPGATLAYDTQTANFTVGNTLTGATSGATARITADTDAGATGTLTLQDITGTFVDNEIITDGAGGSATVNGIISQGNAALVGAVTALRAAQETNVNWNATFAANGTQIELQVTGDTNQTVEWSADVEAFTDQGTNVILAAQQGTGASIVFTVISGSPGAWAVGNRIEGVSNDAFATMNTDVQVGPVVSADLINVSGVFVIGDTLYDLTAPLAGDGFPPRATVNSFTH